MRKVLVALVIAPMVMLSSAGTASASPTSKTKIVQPGGIWTDEVAGFGCAVETIGQNLTFTDDLGGGGTYTGGAAKVTFKITSGEDRKAKFKGTWSSAQDEYVGTWIAGTFKGIAGYWVPGHVPTYNGFTC